MTGRGAALIWLVGTAMAAALVVHLLQGASQWFGLAAIGVGIVWGSKRLDAPMRLLEQDVNDLRDGKVTQVPPTSTWKDVQRVRELVNQIVTSGVEKTKSVARDQADLEALLNRMDEGVIALVDDGTLRVANRAARAILRLPQSIRGPHLSSVPRRELRAVLEAALETSIRPREVSVADRVVLVESNLSEDGVAIVSLRDVTDVRRLEEVRTDFVANASHELKTPLTAVRGFAETLLEDDPPEEIRTQFLTLIHDNTLRLQAIVEDLLDLSRLESGGWAPDLEPVEVAEVAQQAWEEVVETRGATRGFEIQGDGVVMVDRRGLNHILRNLVDNALRHTEPDGLIRVVIRPKSEDRVEISVEDNGSGIPPDALPRIFERFFRVDRARSRAHGGTGLGLAIVSHLSTRMGGEVSAESQYGVGTKIRVVLPGAP